MALKGAQAKEEITKKILEVFPSAFQYDKEIRIPWTENGEQVQIKLTLTAAKVMVNDGGDAAMPGGAAEEVAVAPVQATLDAPKVANIETSAAEKENLSKLLRSLGL